MVHPMLLERPLDNRFAVFRNNSPVDSSRRSLAVWWAILNSLGERSDFDLFESFYCLTSGLVGFEVQMQTLRDTRQSEADTESWIWLEVASSYSNITKKYRLTNVLCSKFRIKFKNFIFKISHTHFLNDFTRKWTSKFSNYRSRPIQLFWKQTKDWGTNFEN